MITTVIVFPPVNTACIATVTLTVISYRNTSKSYHLTISFSVIVQGLIDSTSKCYHLIVSFSMIVQGLIDSISHKHVLT